MNHPEPKLRVLIVDDEALARCLIREFLRPHSGMEIIGECDNGADAADRIERDQPDLVFLDIQMPRLTGLDVLELTGRRHGVIFTTAYDQYALKAFDLHAVDYLLKPFTQQRFDEALAKARLQLQTGAPPTALSGMLDAAARTPQRLLVRDRGHVHVIALEKITYVEAQDDYITIHADGKTYMKTQSLSDLENQLDPAQFIRIHRAFLLHLPALKNLERTGKDSLTAVLHDGNRLPVSRSGHERIKGKL